MAKGRKRKASQKRRGSKRFKSSSSMKSVGNARTGGFVGIEKKFFDSAYSAVAMNFSTDGASGEMQPTAGGVNCISCPTQGSGANQRTGRKLTITEASVSGAVYEIAAFTETTPGQAPGGYFFALVLDKQTNQSVYDSEDVFVNPTADTQAMVPFPLRNLEHSQRFTVLDSQYVRPPPQTSYAVSSSSWDTRAAYAPAVSLFWRGKINVIADGTSASVTNVSDNAIHLIAYSTGPLASVFEGKARIRFFST